MWSKFSKNSILQGVVDYYCLVCEFLLRSESDVEAHIEKPIHKKSLEKTAFVASCTDDHIRKVSKGYYCEYCNVYLTTMSKVNLHKTEDEHVFNKTDGADDARKPCFLKWVRNAVIAFDDLLIPEGSWNGFVDETCVLCDLEFDNRDIHRSQMAHVLRLIQSKVQIGGDNSLSRKIDDSMYQCLTCNAVVASSALPAHFDSPEHKKRYLECRKMKRSLKNNNENVNPNVAKEENKDSKQVKEESKQDSKQFKGEKCEEVVAEVTNAAKKKKKNKKDKAVVTENAAEPTAVKTIPREFTVDAKNVLGTTDFINTTDKETPKCMLCEITLMKHEVKTHVASTRHQKMEKLQIARNEKMMRKFKDKCPESTKHENLVQAEEHRKPQKEMNEAPAVDTTVNDAEPEKEMEDPEDNTSKILESIQVFQKNNVLIDLISEKAYCKKCSLTLKYVYQDIERHIAEHQTEIKVENKVVIPENFIKADEATVETKAKVDLQEIVEEESKPKAEVTNEVEEYTSCEEEPTSTEESQSDATALAVAVKPANASKATDEDAEDLASFAKSHHLTYNKEFSKAFCRICDMKIPASLKSMREHVGGGRHRLRGAAAPVADMRPPEPPYATRPMDDYIHEVFVHETTYKHEVIINKEIAIDVLSFLMMTEVSERLKRCHVCEVNVCSGDEDEHARSRKHKPAMKSTPVVELHEEFVREVRPGVFHCGFCNLVESGWAAMAAHLAGGRHESVKRVAQWSLIESCQALRQRNEYAEEYVMMHFMRMMMGNRRFF